MLLHAIDQQSRAMRKGDLERFCWDDKRCIIGVSNLYEMNA
jgi:hypothetical protein